MPEWNLKFVIYRKPFRQSCFTVCICTHVLYVSARTCVCSCELPRDQSHSNWNKMTSSFSLWHWGLSLPLLLMRTQHDRSHAVKHIHTYMHPVNQYFLPSHSIHKSREAVIDTSSNQHFYWQPLSHPVGCVFKLLVLKKKKAMCDILHYCVWHNEKGPRCWRKKQSVRLSDASVNQCSNWYRVCLPTVHGIRQSHFSFDSSAAILCFCFSPCHSLSQNPPKNSASKVKYTETSHLPHSVHIPFFFIPLNFKVPHRKIEQWVFLVGYQTSFLSLAFWLLGLDSAWRLVHKAALHPPAVSANFYFCCLLVTSHVLTQRNLRSYSSLHALCNTIYENSCACSLITFNYDKRQCCPCSQQNPFCFTAA